MKEKLVVIEIDEEGNSTIDLHGFQGKGCADVAKAFQGHDVVKTSRTKADWPKLWLPHVRSYSPTSASTLGMRGLRRVPFAPAPQLLRHYFESSPSVVHAGER